MKKVFVFTMFFVTILTAVFFLENIRLRYWSEKNSGGTFADISSREADKL